MAVEKIVYSSSDQRSTRLAYASGKGVQRFDLCIVHIGQMARPAYST